MVSLIVGLLGSASVACAEWPVTVTDAAGREVTVPTRPERVVLTSGFSLLTLALIHPDPVSLLAGWTGDLSAYNATAYEAFAARFPALADVPVVGSGAPDGFSLEAAVAVSPDLVIVPSWQLDTERGRLDVAHLEDAGIPVVVIDFNRHPLADTAAGMRMLGRVLGRDEQAEAYARFYEERLAVIRDRVAGDPGRGPSVLIDAYPTADVCCWAFGPEGISELVTLVGGHTVGGDRLPPLGGALDPEFVIAADPDVYIATGIPDSEGSVSVGPGVAESDARASLERIAQSPLREGLSAMRTGRVHAIWNFFIGVPINILAFEAMASWLRPDLFPDLDPVATLAEINRRFAAVPFEGAFWVSTAKTP
ncbi:ABC transporter substrate-binding protein [Marinivivus vitaminiproducens]|nr:ABC transporter substrate-binding protein [Geminicoccaceae bacterium SCSIO 64248]